MKMINNVSRLPYTDSVRKKLNKLVDELQTLDGIVVILLFGSYARMEQTCESDLDILAVTESEVERSIRGELCSSFEERGADLVFYTRDNFEHSERLFIQKVRKEGVVLWARQGHT